MNRTTRRFYTDALREVSTVRFQQHLEEEFGKLGTERVTEVESHIQEEKQLKEAIKEAAEQTIGPKLDRRGRFDDERRRVLEEKNAAYKKWMDRPTRAKRLEYERLRKIAHNVCKSKKRTHMDNRIRNIEENIKNKQIRNAYKEVGALKAGFQPYTDLCRGMNNEILSKEEIKTRCKTYFQDLLTTSATVTSEYALKDYLHKSSINRGGTGRRTPRYTGYRDGNTIDEQQ